MSIRLIGAVLILSGCGWFGCSMANAHRGQEKALRQLIRGMEWMEWDLQFRQTALPVLCTYTAGILSGRMGDIFSQLGELLENGDYPDAGTCMDAILRENPDFPEGIEALLSELGHSLGRFDLNGQLGSLRSIHAQCESRLKELGDNRENRLRSYQTLGLCTGAALAILLL